MCKYNAEEKQVLMVPVLISGRRQSHVTKWCMGDGGDGTLASVEKIEHRDFR